MFNEHADKLLWATSQALSPLATLLLHLNFLSLSDFIADF